MDKDLRDKYVKGKFTASEEERQMHRELIACQTVGDLVAFQTNYPDATPKIIELFRCKSNKVAYYDQLKSSTLFQNGNNTRADSGVGFVLQAYKTDNRY